jgi:hypothetical protein
VETVSSKLSGCGEAVMMSRVRLLPPSESLNRNVSFESRCRKQHKKKGGEKGRRKCK